MRTTICLKQTMLLLIIATSFQLSYSEPTDTIRWAISNKRKEFAEWKRDMIVGSRKLYNENGKLIEEHTFSEKDIVILGRNKSGIGTLKTYYLDGSIASVVPVIQEYKDNQYTVSICAKTEVKGYYQGTTTLAYSFLTDGVVKLSSVDTYEKFNSFYPDPFLLRKDVIIPGLDPIVIFYDKQGNKIQNSQKNDASFEYVKNYYPNKQIKEEGKLYHASAGNVFRVGKWKEYSEKGILLREYKYWDGTTGIATMKYGDFIDTAKYYYPDGKLQMVVLGKTLKDFKVRIDTLLSYYPNGNLAKKYDEGQKVYMVNNIANIRKPLEFSGKYEEYYENGNLKMSGFYSKVPRRKLSKEEQADEYIKCALAPGNKKVGSWYFFDEKGVLIKIKKYRINGVLYSKDIQPDKKEIESQASDYKRNKKKFKFDDEILISQ